MLQCRLYLCTHDGIREVIWWYKYNHISNSLDTRYYTIVVMYVHPTAHGAILKMDLRNHYNLHARQSGSLDGAVSY